MPGWDELAALSLARQFPLDANPDAAPTDAAALVAAVGPIQSQTARSPYLGLIARSPTLTRADIDSAYAAAELVRGSSIRGTVHTSTAPQQVLLDVVTRHGQRALFERSLGRRGPELDRVWQALEDFADPQWRTVDELVEQLRRSLDRPAGAGDETATQPAPSPAAALDAQFIRYLGFGSGALVRRPVNGDWAGQGRPEYRRAAAVHGRARPDDEPVALAAAVRLHVRSHGPVSRHDIAWWSGLGLRQVDAALDRLELARLDGPDGRTYVDVPDAPGPIALPGVRLLPEFDAVFCGYDAKTRDRFVTPERHAVLWNSRNGGLAPLLLVDGQVTGWWRLDGSGRRRAAQVHWFAGTRRPTKAELAVPFDRAAAVLDLELTGLTVSRISA